MGSAVCSSAGSGKATWTNIPTCAAVSCPLKKIPNSDKEDGITGEVGEAVAVTCHGRESFAVRCLGVSPGEAIWSGFEACPKTPANMCSPLIVRNGKASTTSFTKILETVDVTCDNGYERVGDKSALCIPEHPNKAAWKNIPKCEGVPCPPKKIPYSNRPDGITGKVGEAVFVKCNDVSRDPFFVECAVTGLEKPAWTGFTPCPAIQGPILQRGSSSDATIVALSTYLWAMLLFV